MHVYLCISMYVYLQRVVGCKKAARGDEYLVLVRWMGYDHDDTGS